MELIRIKLGKYIELFSEKCNIPNLSNDDVSGVNKDKEFFEPSNQVGSDTSKYKIVPPGYFACNLMHVGRDVVLPIAYNHSNNNKIVSPAYQVFKFLDNEELLSEYFFLYLKSSEIDRFFWFNTDGSVRDGMSWHDFIGVEMELPPLPIQQKYVDVYNAMLENQKNYERGLEDLKLVCDAYVENLRRQMLCEAIGPYIEEFNQKNIDNLKLNSVRGIATSKEFINTKANMEGVSLENYKVVEPGMIAFISDTSRRADKMSLALNQSEENYLVSSISTVIQTDNTKLLPKYLYLFFCRTEFDRYARFHSWGSARETFSLDDMKEVRMPLPPIYVQKAIVGIYEAYTIRKEINEKLKAQIKDICPILIKGSLEEGYNE